MIAIANQWPAQQSGARGSVSVEKQHVAHPQLMGASAQRRRRSDSEEPWRPLGPDDLPLERLRSQEDNQLAEELFPHAYMSRYVMTGGQRPNSAEVAIRDELAQPRRLSLRAIAVHFRGRDRH